MIARLNIAVRGAVQGVGFRPFIWRLAKELALTGWVRNGSSGVFIEAEGERGALDHFLLSVENQKPPAAVITSLEFSFLDPVGHQDFVIRESSAHEEKSTLILPDIAVCDDCLRELFDPHNRRYLYPFINCTHCGPRFTIIEALPYDRPNTSMRDFPMCDDCRREYENPADRRFHAQPIACPACGPQLALWDARGRSLAIQHDALLSAVTAVRAGKIVALKGIGGFQLIVDAGNDAAVERLRQRKHREEKPFALMFADPAMVQAVCRVSAFEARLLKSPEAPIVLLERLGKSPLISPSVAPGNPNLGVMLPYSPLHHLLMRGLGRPIVATSGNLSEEPIIVDEREALTKLADIADAHLVHNRRIVRHADDSILRVFRDREMMLRRARGFAPLPIPVESMPARTIAVGGHLKNTVAVAVSEGVMISQHLGDLSTPEAECAFERVIEDFRTLYDLPLDSAACDLHPDYFSTRFAQRHFSRIVPVQHHAAHVAACMAENQLVEPVLGVAWDGIGYGADGNLWGSEFFLFDGGVRHVAQLRAFLLPGGEQAIREPRRSALGLLFEIFGAAAFDMPLKCTATFSATELSTLKQMLTKGINSPRTGSVGRLFDAVAALLDVRQKMSYEGQAAMMLEWRAQPGVEEAYSFELRGTDFIEIDFEKMIRQILAEIDQAPTGVISAKFHNTLAAMIVAVAEKMGVAKVALSGGVFQNVYLLEQAISRLERRGFKPYWHQRVPTNDGGISLGQLMLAAAG